MNKRFNEAHTASGVCLILRRNMMCRSQDPLSMCFQWLPPHCNWSGEDATVTAREPLNTPLYRKNVPTPRRDTSDVSCSQSSASGLSLLPASILTPLLYMGRRLLTIDNSIFQFAFGRGALEFVFETFCHCF